jgi:hypothetical protein
VAWHSRLLRRSPGRSGSAVRLPDGTEVVLPREFGELTVEELAALGITPGMGEPSTASLVRTDP